MYKFSYFEECFVILNYERGLYNLEKLASHVKTFNCTLGLTHTFGINYSLF